MASQLSALEYISSRIDASMAADEKEALTALKDLYEKKLWHQLTEKVREIVDAARISQLRELYMNFLRSVESKLNSVTLVQIAGGIVRAELSSSNADALEFLQTLLGSPDDRDTVFKKNPEAHVMLLSHISYLQIQAGDHQASKESFEWATDLVDLSNMSPEVYSVYFRAAAEFHKVVGTAFDFFQNALQFLAYTRPESLSADMQRRWAFDIGMAAVVGVGIYNFGEVLSHSIIQSLNGTENEWLLRLLEAFSNGDLTKFDQVCSQYVEQMNAQDLLVAHEEFIKQKITILALLELAFSRSLEHSISFEDVEKACRLPTKEVEYLLMRAMSLGLISGVIDNVDQSFSVSRVRPRVLGRKPIAEMAERLSKWCGKVDNTLNFVDGSAIGVAE